MEKSFFVTGITVRNADYKDNDKLVTIFTKEYGRLDVAIRGCKKSSSPLLPLSSNFCYGKFSLYNSGNRISVNQCEVLHSFYDLSFDIERFGVASFILSTCAQIATPMERHGALFALAINLLIYLEKGEIEPKQALFCFCLKSCDIYGVRPSLYFCASCGKEQGFRSFSIEEGGLLCSDCTKVHKAFPIRQNHINLMGEVFKTRNRELNGIEMPEDYLVNLVVRYATKNLSLSEKSIKFLKKINIIK